MSARDGLKSVDSLWILYCCAIFFFCQLSRLEKEITKQMQITWVTERLMEQFRGEEMNNMGPDGS